MYVSRLGATLVPAVLFLSIFTLAFGEGTSSTSQIIFSTDKQQYHTGDSIIISGQVTEKKMPVIAMKIFDPAGTIISANSLDIIGNGTFSRTISADVSFYEVPGIYIIKMEYGKLSSNTGFEIVGQNNDDTDVQIPTNSDVLPEIVTLETDKQIYYDNEKITITGAVSAKTDAQVLVGIYDSFGTPTGFYLADIEPDLSFHVTFLTKSGVNFKTEGTYFITATYGEAENVTTFDFAENAILVYTPKQDQINENKQPQITNVKEQKKTVNDKSDIVSFNPISKTKQDQSNVNTKQENIQESKLTAEEIESGRVLNQINLNCDKSEFVDVIRHTDNMGPALHSLCKYDEAILFYDQSLISNPDDVETMVNKGSALSRLGYYSEAITYYDGALKINAKYLPALNNKANALVLLGDYESAISTYQYALDIDPRYSLVADNLEKAKEKFSSLNEKQFGSENEATQDQKSNTAFVSDESDTKEKNMPVKDGPNIIEQIGMVLFSIGKSLFGG